MDMPTIGPDTVRSAARARLAGIVVQADGVQILDRAETVRLADENDLFLWARAKGDTTS